MYWDLCELDSMCMIICSSAPKSRFSGFYIAPFCDDLLAITFTVYKCECFFFSLFVFGVSFFFFFSPPHLRCFHSKKKDPKGVHLFTLMYKTVPQLKMVIKLVSKESNSIDLFFWMLIFAVPYVPKNFAKNSLPSYLHSLHAEYDQDE